MVPTWKRSTVTRPRETQEQNEGKDGEKSVVKKQTYTPGTSVSRHTQQDDTRPNIGRVHPPTQTLLLTTKTPRGIIRRIPQKEFNHETYLYA